MKKCTGLDSLEILNTQEVLGLADIENLSDDLMRAVLPVKMPLLRSIKITGSLCPASIDHVPVITCI